MKNTMNPTTELRRAAKNVDAGRAARYFATSLLRRIDGATSADERAAVRTWAVRSAQRILSGHLRNDEFAIDRASMLLIAAAATEVAA